MFDFPTGALGMIAGMEVFESELVLDYKQFRFPKSKKRRIKKKWTKREVNWRNFPGKKALIFNNKMFVHPETYKKIQEAVNESDGFS